MDDSMRRAAPCAANAMPRPVENAPCIWVRAATTALKASNRAGLGGSGQVKSDPDRTGVSSLPCLILLAQGQ